jgi:hypothetical protein
VSDVDISNPEEVRTYLKQNMAEGYLSGEESMNIDEFVDQYEELLGQREEIDEIVEEVFGSRVQ